MSHRVRPCELALFLHASAPADDGSCRVAFRIIAKCLEKEKRLKQEPDDDTQAFRTYAQGENEFRQCSKVGQAVSPAFALNSGGRVKKEEPKMRQILQAVFANVIPDHLACFDFDEHVSK